jgi:hypothetical protein
MRPVIAHCHLGLARSLRSARRQSEAEQHFSVATAMYQQMGIDFWLPGRSRASSSRSGTSSSCPPRCCGRPRRRCAGARAPSGGRRSPPGTAASSRRTRRQHVDGTDAVLLEVCQPSPSQACLVRREFRQLTVCTGILCAWEEHHLLRWNEHYEKVHAGGPASHRHLFDGAAGEHKAHSDARLPIVEDAIAGRRGDDRASFAGIERESISLLLRKQRAPRSRSSGRAWATAAAPPADVSSELRA